MVHLHQVEVPESLAAPSAWTLREIERLDRESSLELAGHDDFSSSAHELLVALRHQDDHQRIDLLALPEPGARTALGWVCIELPKLDNTDDAWVLVVTDERHRRQGIGQALHDAALAIAHDAKRSKIRSYSSYRAEPPDGLGALNSPTGAGRIPADAAATRFALRNGYRLGQVERASDQPIPPDAARLAPLRAEAEAAAGEAYRTVSWVGPCPEEYVDSLCRLHVAMSRDIPMGELDFGAEVWDAARVRAGEARLAERGAIALTTTALHVATGELAAYTQLVVPASHPEAAFQETTIVLGAHRGHRLGMLVKLGNLDLLAREAPQVRRVHTWNAEENQYMLAINVALGYAPSGVEGQWLRG